MMRASFPGRPDDAGACQSSLFDDAATLQEIFRRRKMAATVSQRRISRYRRGDSSCVHGHYSRLRRFLA